MISTSFRLSAFPTLAAAALLAGTAMPAQAANTTGNANRSEATNAQSQPRAERRAGNRRICVRGNLTGSHVTRTICKTEQEWEESGGLPTDED